MSTNYYLKLHMGKTHAGEGGVVVWTWDESLITNRDFLHALGDGEITNESGQSIAPEDFMDLLRESVVKYSDRAFS